MTTEISPSINPMGLLCPLGQQYSPLIAITKSASNQGVNACIRGRIESVKTESSKVKNGEPNRIVNSKSNQDRNGDQRGTADADYGTCIG